MFKAVIAFEKGSLSKEISLCQVLQKFTCYWNTIIPGGLEVVTTRRLNEAGIIDIIYVNWSANINSHWLILPRWKCWNDCGQILLWYLAVLICWGYLLSLLSVRLWFCLLTLNHYNIWEKKADWDQAGRHISAQLAAAPKIWLILTMLYMPLWVIPHPVPAQRG